MKNTLRTKISSACLAALTISSTTAVAAPAVAFRGEAPVNRPATTAEPISFRDSADSADVAVRSAVAVTVAGLASKDFVPTTDAGPGNFEKRPYRFSFSINEGYDDNIYTSNTNEQDSFFTSAALGAALRLSNGRTSLDANLSVGGAYYYDREDDDSVDPDISLNLAFSHVFTPKLRLDISSFLSYQAEPDFSSGFGENRRSGNYFYGNVGFSLAQTITRRFNMVYGYTVGGVYYEESAIGDFSDRLEQTFSLQFRYLIQPTISLVAEYRYGLVTYDSADRDSNTNFALAGVDFTLNRRLTASIRAGAQFRDADDTGEDTSPFVESTMAYTFSEGSSLQWINRYGYEESDFGFQSTRKTYRTGLSLNQRVASRISLTGGVFFTTSDYESEDTTGFAFNNDDQDEQTLDLNIGAVYLVNRLLSLQTGYTYTEVFSENDFREYDRNRVFVGATLSF